MRIVMLDACRNNPFSEINKTSGRGLAIVDAPPGSLVSYATAPGSEAEDGEGANSPYTRALLTVAREPGLPIEQALKRMRFAVHDATARRQTPWESSSLTGDFSFFAGPGASAKAAEQKPTLVSAPASRTRVASRSVESWTKELRARPAAEAYELVIKEDTPEAYQAFISLHSGQPFGSATRAILERRREMIAWYTAVTVNTVVSLQEFLALYPNSDLAISARGLMTRAANRSYISIPAPCECSQPVPPPTQRRATTRSNRAAVQPQTPAPRVQQQQPQRVIIIDNNPPPRIQPFPIRPIGPIYPPGRPPIISDPVRPPSGRPPVITDPVRPPSGKPPVIAEPGRPPSIGVRPIGPIGPVQRHPTGGGPVIR
jgi:hypothetical protein